MAVRIRLTRVGATKRPAYRVVAIDRRRSRDGRALEILGYYDPLTDPATVNLDTERINAWIGKGAQPSDTVAKLIRLASQPATEARPKPKPKPSAKARAKAAQAEAPADATPSEEPASADEPTTDEAAATTPAAGEPEPSEQPAEAPDDTDQPDAERSES